MPTVLDAQQIQNGPTQQPQEKIPFIIINKCCQGTNRGNSRTVQYIEVEPKGAGFGNGTKGRYVRFGNLLLGKGSPRKKNSEGSR